MRGLPVSAFLVAILTCPAAGVAQPYLGDESRVDDPSGDVQLSLQMARAGVNNAAVEHVDILSVWMGAETVETVEIGAKLRRWEEPAPSNRRFEFHFAFRNRDFQVRYPWGTLTYDCQSSQAGLTSTTPGRSNWNLVCLNVTIDAPQATIRISIPRQHIVDERLGDWEPGTELVNLWLLVRGGISFGNNQDYYNVTAFDRAPDQGSGRPLVSRFGRPQQGGPLYLIAPLKTRVSNGESTTFAFQVTALNRDSQADVVEVRIENDNPDWTVRAPERLRVPENGEVAFPVILTMNFTHEHGTNDTIRVVAQSIHHVDRVADVPLEVRWRDVPQPAGHHDRFWLHSLPSPDDHCQVPCSLGSISEMWLNALETDPRPGATDRDVGAQDGGLPGRQTEWSFPLSPALEVGLHLEANREGLFRTSLRSTVPATRASLEATILYCDPLATVAAGTMQCRGGYVGVPVLKGSSGPQPLSSGVPSTFEISLKVSTERTILTYLPRTNLQLRLVLTTDTPQVVPSLQREPTVILRIKDSFLQFPLAEYHDPVDQAFENVGMLTIAAQGPFERRLNPGRTTRLPFQIINRGSEAQRIELSVEGYNADWAATEPSQVEIRAHESSNVTVSITAPDDASPGERAELFLIAESKTNPNVVALSRLRATLVDLQTEEIPDEKAGETAGIQASTPSLWFAQAALAVAVGTFVLRRRLPRNPG